MGKVGKENIDWLDISIIDIVCSWWIVDINIDYGLITPVDRTTDRMVVLNEIECQCTQ